MNVWQILALLVSIGIFAWIALFIFGCADAAHRADEEADRQWEKMKGGQE